MYTKCGSMLNARQVFDKMSQRDAVSWTALISGYVQNGDGIEALNLFREMHGEGLKMDRFSLCSVLRGCAGMAALESGQQFHSHVIKLLLEGDVIVGSALVDMYAKCASLENAQKIFDRMPERNVVTWTAMVCGYAQNGQFEEFFHLFGQMQRLRVELNFVTYVGLLTAFSNSGYPEHGRQIHGCIVKVGLAEDVSVANALASMYIKCGRMEDAFVVFDRLPNPNLVSWTAMITGYAQHEHGEEALKLFIQMCNANQNPNQFTYAGVVKACATDGAMEEGRQLHSHVIKSGIERHVYVGNALITLYGRCGSMQSAQKAFEDIQRPDVISYTALLAGFAQNDLCMQAFNLFCKMQRSDMEIDNFVFATVLSASASLGALGMGNQLHAHAIKDGFEYDLFIQNALVDMYIKCRSMKDAQNVFDKMLHKDVASWNVMISGYSQSGHGENALKLFFQMQERGIDKELVTFTSVLRASASLAVVEQGRQVHGLIFKTGYESDVSVGNTLADMYAKSGSIHSAHKVFDNMPKKDSVTYNVIISGYSQHGHEKKALQFFEEMQLAHMPPNDITFICVLSACSHVGLVNEGRNYFKSMTQDHNIKPRMEHYACMVDLLSRAGCFDEAENFIREMPFQPAAVIWRTLLGACRIHGNIELGKHAAKCALELEPQDSATYLLLSNMFVVANLQIDAVNVRKLMKDRRVRKEPGQSWIQLKDEVHSFIVGDTFHSQTV
ncbi:pentatricopeptide repeat-containing protein At4g13650 [Cryptomeria japonica]|uniref:pentatricopeptide repeat-containing protein At4g13650 n=1 Tax=Cryptomeria japonica TaxID=3369 RepID=UPI0027D9D883|nr:pentatricopeptide repeat-containing protein At4g13650 [Cryptomeria japonica]